MFGIAAPLHHKEDTVRADAVTVCGALARQCTDADAVKAFVSTIFDVYFGADGKLTVTTHKVSVLQVCYDNFHLDGTLQLRKFFIPLEMSVMTSDVYIYNSYIIICKLSIND